ncbi:MAG: apolipoprotein N-acyltransferase [Caulobacter vibrioides]|uniref:Apolipoprotein N-acyltransferase n=1 Tax=Caulobacter vibrioides TaxID=155892 RepID=A0A258DFQ2_CAUVI|nr:MAG: apolipoprotein N-acyltransferase [Caulobacter vibrioides]
MEATERRALAGAPGLLLALAAGAAAGLAHPPFGFLPGLLGFALLLHVIDAAPLGRWRRAAFARGWAAGFGYFLVGTWWVGEAFMVDAAAHGWQAPFAMALLPAGLGLFWGAAALAYRAAAPKGPLRVLVFAALFALTEWLRGHVLTGFPWDLPGEAWKAGGAVSQTAALVGVYGLSLVTLAIGAAPAVFGGPDSRRARIATVGAAALVLAALWAFGATRVAQARVADTGLVVRMVQPNIPQAMKWSPAEFRAIVERYVSLTAAPAARTPDVVVWPESAIPDAANRVLASGTWTLDAIVGALTPNQVLLAGLYREEGDKPRYYNSLIALRRQGGDLALLGLYDKHTLVPFGEYLPLEGWLDKLGLSALAGFGESFTAGRPPRPMTPAGLPRLQPLICYESLFPGYARGPDRPAWIVNVSNDAWFGRTSGPLQHLNLASYRAIEQGVPLVRSTPTGVSAMIDALGRTRASLGSGESGVLDAVLPGALPPTPYSRWGDAPFWGMTLAGLACAIRRRKAKS